MKKALITGITGQDGSYLAELLLEQGYQVYGIVRKDALEADRPRLSNISHLLDQVCLITGTLESFPSLYAAIKQVDPDEIYHLAAKSYVNLSLDEEFESLNTNVNGAYRLLSAWKELAPKARFYFASSSEMFGEAQSSPQNEDTPFMPRSIYGISKLTGFHLIRNYRKRFNLFACSGILYNHESPRRGYEFVTRKISVSAARIKLGLQSKIKLGNIDSMRDWGHSKEYVKAMWLMLQQDEPRDFVIASGELHSVRDFLDEAFRYIDLDYRDYLEFDKRFDRPSEAVSLCGDSSRARKQLGWNQKIKFQDLVHQMVEYDLHNISKKPDPGSAESPPEPG